MDIYGYLKKDHRKVSRLFEKITASSVPTRKKLFEQLKEELTIHADAEDKTFYNALRKRAPGKACADHGTKEHNEIKKRIRQLEKTSHSANKWLVLLGELKRTVDHHVNDEEGEMFKVAKKILSNKQAEALAIEMDELKKKKLATSS